MGDKRATDPADFVEEPLTTESGEIVTTESGEPITVRVPRKPEPQGESPADSPNTQGERAA